MCEYGTTVRALVTIPADLSKTGKEYQKLIQVDKCIANLVQALHNYGIKMLSSCCGHGKENGYIVLEDGRILVIK